MLIFRKYSSSFTRLQQILCIFAKDMLLLSKGLDDDVTLIYANEVFHNGYYAIFSTNQNEKK